MPTVSSYSTFQLSGDESNRQKDEHSYQMQQYLQADQTVTGRLAQSATSMEGKKGSKKHSTKESMKKLKGRLADLEDVIQGTSSSAV
ncbi:uncharacterized protein PAC_17718 [Phialocephala subalpina]|uniref:Uncharacterized protein n=1 Tax=Phialocephala subalpina TaxID=576137 RepID=A0A1L7XS65_9HELO|nr:uncharacterized protein PAC_17718 [Phialocephala subalpina]